jgi:hypothetical protein
MRSLVLALFVAALARPAYACSCVRQNDADAFRSSDVVILAKVTGTDEDEGRFRVFDLEVESVWKGDPARAMQIVTGHGGGDCGRSLAADQHWIFFSWVRPGGRLGTGNCDNSRLATKDEITKMTTKFGAAKNPKK